MHLYLICLEMHKITDRHQLKCKIPDSRSWLKLRCLSSVGILDFESYLRQTMVLRFGQYRGMSWRFLSSNRWFRNVCLGIWYELASSFLAVTIQQVLPCPNLGWTFQIQLIQQTYNNIKFIINNWWLAYTYSGKLKTLEGPTHKTAIMLTATPDNRSTLWSSHLG